MKVGIDLGTTYSAVARYDRNSNKPVMIPNAFGKEITPSVICFLDDGDILVGEDAKDMQSNGTGVNAAAFKRNMGDGSIAVSFNGKDYTSEDLSAMLLKHLIADAEKATGEKIDEAVITVPAYFNDFQRTATIRAGESCGVKVPKIINEPTAAAISYGYKHSSDKTVMVYDLGGGTFDVTIVRISKGNIEVVGTEGNHILGGKDWDAAIVKYVCDQFIDEFDVDPRDDLPTKNELIVAAEGYKKTLSIAESVTIPLNYDGYSAKYTLTRDEFESMTEHLLVATKDVCVDLIQDLGMSWTDIDEILLVGGSTRMPSVARFLKDLTGREVIAHSDTDLAVAKGAAITAELYCSNATGLRAMQIADVTAHSLGILSVSQDGKKFVNEIMRGLHPPGRVQGAPRLQRPRQGRHLRILQQGPGGHRRHRVQLRRERGRQHHRLPGRGATPGGGAARARGHQVDGRKPEGQAQRRGHPQEHRDLRRPVQEHGRRAHRGRQAVHP